MVTKLVRVGRVVYEYGLRGKSWVLLRVLCGFIWVLVVMLNPIVSTAWANSPTVWENIPTDKIVDAIYVAEGGKSTKHPFGILSVKCSGYEECRKICTNTVNNNKKRYANYTGNMDFIEFLGNRYAPVGADNDNGTNKYWVRNVKALLVKNR